MKQHLLDIIAQGKLKDALDLMRTLGSTQDKYFTNPLVSLLSRYARNESSKDARRISEENYNIEFNLIELDF